MQRNFKANMRQGVLVKPGQKFFSQILKNRIEVILLFAFCFALFVENPSVDYVQNSVVAICVYLALILSAVKKNTEEIRSRAVPIFIIIWVCILITYCLISPVISLALIYTSFLVFIPLFIAAGLMQSINVVFLLKLLRIFSIFVAAHCIIEYIMTGERSSFFVIDPNFIGGILGFFFIGYFFEFINKKLSSIKAHLLCSLLIGVGMATTLSRSSFLLTVFVIIFLIVISNQVCIRKRIYAAVIQLLVFVVSWGVLITITSLRGGTVVQERMSSGSHSMSARIEIWAASVKMFQEAPVFGKGLGSFHSYYPEYRTEFSTVGTFVHNDYLQFFTEGGVLLGSFYLFIGAGFCYVFIRRLRKIDTESLAFDQYRSSIALQCGTLLLLAQAGVNFIFYIAGSSLLLATGFMSLAAKSPYKVICRNLEKSQNTFSTVVKFFAIVLCVVGIIYNLSVWSSSHSAEKKTILTRIGLKLSEKDISALEMHLNVNPFIHRPLIPLSESAILTVGSKMTALEKEKLKQRMIEYFYRTLEHRNLRCLNKLLAADFVGEFPNEQGVLMEGTRDEILAQAYAQQPKCELYYSLLIGDPVPTGMLKK